MTLKGEAKTAYQREYMRRRRAGLKPGPAPSAPRAEPLTDTERGRLSLLEAENSRLREQLAQARKAAPASSQEDRAEIERLPPSCGRHGITPARPRSRSQGYKGSSSSRRRTPRARRRARSKRGSRLLQCGPRLQRR